jgi:tetratricopeptide (TPR) repeat protein
MRTRASFALFAMLALGACSAEGVSAPVGEIVATSLLGTALHAPQLDAGFRAEQERLLSEARAELEARPDDPEARIWVGRRLAYLGRYREAIETYTEGAARYPDDPRFLRHRGHRRITTRRLDDAVRDLERAAAMIRGQADRVEPDGLPNARNTPTGTLHSNVWYHLGLARYLLGDFEGALDAYRACLEVSNNPDMLVATSHWLYMTLRRLEREDEARAVLEPIRAGMDIIENHDYHRLLMMYRGESTPEELTDQAGSSGVGPATTAYGVGNWYLYNDDAERARSTFERILETDTWAAFGYVAAEAELARGRAADTPDR